MLLLLVRYVIWKLLLCNVFIVKLLVFVLIFSVVFLSVVVWILVIVFIEKNVKLVYVSVICCFLFIMFKIFFMF